MPDYKKMYSILFNQITNAVEQLKEAQQKTEEIYMSSDDTPMKFVTDKDNPKND